MDTHYIRKLNDARHQTSSEIKKRNDYKSSEFSDPPGPKA